MKDIRATVLVVEDDIFVREMIVDVLLEAGFAVHEAGCAKEALLGFAKHPVDAVITDIDMPGELDGIGLARRIGELKPQVGIIVISGGHRSGQALPSLVRFLAKPFTAARLLQSVADLTDDPLYAAS
jgi:two-component system, response regulator PdtaR